MGVICTNLVNYGNSIEPALAAGVSNSSACRRGSEKFLLHCSLGKKALDVFRVIMVVIVVINYGNNYDKNGYNML